MNLRALRTLMEIERDGSFLGVSERLGLTLSAVSLQMKTLERELGVALFDRTFRPPKLTPAGRRIAQHARAIEIEAAAIRAVAEDDEALAGDFRIGFVGTASVRLMPSFLAAARRTLPKARFEVAIDLSTALERALRNGALDAAVLTRTDDLDETLLFAPLRRERFALAAPRSLLVRDAPVGAELRSCADAAPWIQFAPSSGIGVLAADHLRREGVEPTDIVVLDSVEAVMGCVNAEVGFAILPEPDVVRYADPNVAVVPLAGPDLSRELGLAARIGSPLARRADALCALFGSASTERPPNGAP